MKKMKAQTKRLIDEHLKKARVKHTMFAPAGDSQIVAVATEELGEMAKELNDSYFSETTKEYFRHKKLAREEALDLVVVLIRFIEGDL